MTDQKTCLACGSPITIEAGKRAKCSNPNCPGGGVFYRCGFCGKFSFAVGAGKLYCVNARCRMYKMVRRECKDCGLVSRITYKGHDVCMNRNCPSNKDIVQKCFFCGNNSVLVDPRFNFCTKGNCSHLLIPVDVCPVCKERSFNLTKKMCENKACAIFNVPMKECPQCHHLALVNDPKRPDNNTCKNCGYEDKPAASPVDMGENMNATIAFGGITLQDILSAGAQGAPQPENTTNTLMGEPPLPAAPAPSEPAPTAGGGFGAPAAPADQPAAGGFGGFDSPSGAPAAPAPSEPAPTAGGGFGAPAAPADQPAAGGFGGFDSPSGAPAAPTSSEPAPAAGGGFGAPAAPAAQPDQPAAGGGFGTPATPAGMPGFGGVNGNGANGNGTAAAPGFTQPAAMPENGSAWGAAPDGWGGDSGSNMSGEPSIPSPSDKADEASSIVDAFDFIKEHILQDEDRSYPIYMVIGLAGSGKTTYLTMLGEILRLRDEKYYFPYSDITVKFVRVEDVIEERIRKRGGRVPSPAEVRNLKARIKDLVYDYSQQFYNESLGCMHWAGHTRPESQDGDEEEVNSMFLVTEIIRRGMTIGKVVTLETSGEDYFQLISSIKNFEKDTGSPMQRVLFEMLDISEGFVILFSPESPEHNDRVFQDLFLMLKTYLGPRALKKVYSYARDKLLKQSTSGDGNLAQIALEIQKSAKLERDLIAAREKHYNQLRSDLKAMAAKVQAGQELNRDDVKFLDGISKMLEKIEPSMLKKAMDGLARDAKKRKEEALRSFYIGMCKMAMQPDTARRLTLLKFPNEKKEEMAGDVRIPQSERRAIIFDLQKMYDLSPNFNVDLSQNLNYDRSERAMRNLKNLALVVTKADMFHIVYPAESYPKKLRSCRVFLEETDNYLRLLGGRIRYYNASATGYSMLRDTLYYPGKNNTLTPINILEPIFNMMNIEKERSGII